MKEYNFDTREEAINFLDKHNFKYYIPRVCEYMSNIKDELKAYCVELSDSHEVTRCWIVSITDGKKYREIFFRGLHLLQNNITNKMSGQIPLPAEERETT